MKAVITFILALWFGQAGLAQIDLSDADGKDLVNNFIDLKEVYDKGSGPKVKAVSEELESLLPLVKEADLTVDELYYIYDTFKEIKNNNKKKYHVGEMLNKFYTDLSKFVKKVNDHPEEFGLVSKDQTSRGREEITKDLEELPLVEDEDPVKEFLYSWGLLFLVASILIITLIMAHRRKKKSKRQKSVRQTQKPSADRQLPTQTASVTHSPNKPSIIAMLKNLFKEKKNIDDLKDNKVELQNEGDNLHQQNNIEDVQVPPVENKPPSIINPDPGSSILGAGERPTIEQLQARIKQLEEDKLRLEEDKQKLRDEMMQSTEEAAVKKPTASHHSEFYLSTPNKDGSFNESGKSNSFKPYASMYKFTVTGQEGKSAEFEFCSDPSTLPDALNYPDTYLLPVCENNNPTNPHARNIKTQKRGVAEFDGGKWVLKTPARIWFEA